MNGKGDLTFPDIRDNTIQNPITKAFAKDISHDTKVPNFKLWLNVLREDDTSFSERIK
jgi:hypothetical protein